MGRALARGIVLASALCAPAARAGYVPDTVGKGDLPNLAPVRSVNGATGAVTVPTLQRQSSAAIDATSGVVSWTFPTAFANVPTCYESLAATNSSYSFDAPIVTAVSRTSVSVKLSAHPSSLSITALALPIALPLTTTPPPGTTLTLTCVAPGS